MASRGGMLVSELRRHALITKHHSGAGRRRGIPIVAPIRVAPIRVALDERGLGDRGFPLAWAGH